MDINTNIDSPLFLKVSFNKLLDQYETLAQEDDEFISAKASRILKSVEGIPEFREGFSEINVLTERAKEIGMLLRDTFSPLLTKNEIKTASVPLHNLIFNASERFKNIIEAAGDGFELEIKNMPNDHTYIIACTIILNFYYGCELNFKRPFFYEIPDANGVLRYYKILYNADFCEIIRTDRAPELTDADIRELLDNFQNIELWKKKFPLQSYVFKGFVISNMFDVTDDQSISNIKSNLIVGSSHKNQTSIEGFQEIFRSLLGIKDLRTGFSIFNKEEGTFECIHGESGMQSFLLDGKKEAKCLEVLCNGSYNRLLKEKKTITVSNVDYNFAHAEEPQPHISRLHSQGIKSAIFAPIANKNGVMGVLEIVSSQPTVLNSVNANRLVDVMPFIVSAVERSKAEEQNAIEAVIQQECTSIHQSVYWKFVAAARQFLKNRMQYGSNATFGEIVFDDIYPLFGQIDVKGSSDARNLATKKDLLLQLSYVEKIVQDIFKEEPLPIYEEMLFQVNQYTKELKTNFKVDSEHNVVAFLKRDIEPLFQFHLKKDNGLRGNIQDYFDKVDSDLNLIYYYRKNYDDTIMLINKNMAAILDEKQKDAQTMYPHYFERYKTDGVEHNMYIGEAITKTDSFNPIYLYNLRLWQLQVMCEMENEYYSSRHLYPLDLDVASMILVFNQPLSIRFRMDEKQFDVDGTYNARYEVVKKRVDKAFIKGTEERITQNGKITIVYSQKEDGDEYMRYVNFLQSKHVLSDEVEVLELEGLQGVTGLKALRVGILYHATNDGDKTFYTYDDLMKEIKA